MNPPITIQHVANGYTVEVEHPDVEPDTYVFNTLNELIAFLVTQYKETDNDA